MITRSQEQLLDFSGANGQENTSYNCVDIYGEIMRSSCKSECCDCFSPVYDPAMSIGVKLICVGANYNAIPFYLSDLRIQPTTHPSFD